MTSPTPEERALDRCRAGTGTFRQTWEPELPDDAVRMSTDYAFTRLEEAITDFRLIVVDAVKDLADKFARLPGRPK